MMYNYIINFVGSCVALYYMYTVGVKDNNFALIVSILLLIMALSNLTFLLGMRNMKYHHRREGFSLGNINPDNIIDVADINSIRGEYYGEINDKFIFVNSGDILHEVYGDGFAFDVFVLGPGERKEITFPRRGNYMVDIDSIVVKINIRDPQFELPEDYYDKNNTGFTKKYLQFNNDNIFRSDSYN